MRTLSPRHPLIGAFMADMAYAMYKIDQGRAGQITPATSSFILKNPRFLSQMASYDVVNQYLPGPGIPQGLPDIARHVIHWTLSLVSPVEWRPMTWQHFCQAWQPVGPARCCPPHHPPDFEPSFLELIAIL
jgi:hypothetical protein